MTVYVELTATVHDGIFTVYPTWPGGAFTQLISSPAEQPYLPTFTNLYYNGYFVGPSGQIIAQGSYDPGPVFEVIYVTYAIGNVLSQTEYDNLQQKYTLLDPSSIPSAIYFVVSPVYTDRYVTITATLFTTGADTVDFNNLTSAQQAEIAGGADIYHGLGGSDTVTLPNEANYSESVGNGETLSWTDTPTSTFYTGSLVGDIYTVNGSDGDYYIVEGAGTEFITINGNGSSNITAGSGTDTISISGTGSNTVATGSGNEVLSIAGGGSLNIAGTFLGSASIGANSTLELGGPASGGAITFAGSDGTLKIDGTTMPTNVISGFAVGDTIDLAGVSYVNYVSGGGVAVLSSAGNVLNVTELGATYQLDLDPSQNFTSQTFILSPDGNGGTDITIANDPSLLDYLEFSELSYELAPGPFGSPPSQVITTPTDWTESPFTSLSLVNSTGLTDVTFVDDVLGSPDYDDVVIAFRGSVTAHDWFVADPELAVGDPPAQFSSVIPLLNAVEAAYPTSQGYSVFLTGHSLGGAEAEIAAAASGLGGDTFAAPGVGNMLTTSASISNGANLIDYVISDDPVGNHTFLSGQHVGTVVPLPSVTYISNLFLTGLLEAVGGFAVGIGVSALTQHLLYSYGQALADNGDISFNPIPHTGVSRAVFGDLGAIYSNITDLVTSTDSSGDFTESGTIDAVTSNGTAVANISETDEETGVTDFSVTISDGTEAASQSAEVTSAGVISDQIVLNGINISSPLSEPADLNIAADGSILVGEVIRKLRATKLPLMHRLTGRMRYLPVAIREAVPGKSTTLRLKVYREERSIYLHPAAATLSSMYRRGAPQAAVPSRLALS